MENPFLLGPVMSNHRHRPQESRGPISLATVDGQGSEDRCGAGKGGRQVTSSGSVAFIA